MTWPFGTDTSDEIYSIRPCEIVDGKRIGLSASIDVRVMGSEGPSEVLVS